MSVVSRIKQKSLFKKKLTLEDVVKLSGLSYGVPDANYRLEDGKTGSHTILYDARSLARGIELYMEDTDIMLCLSLPTSDSEIDTYYRLIERVCGRTGSKTYIREEEEVSYKDNTRFADYDRDRSIGALQHIEENFKNYDSNRLDIFGVYNPISLGEKEVEEIDGSLYNFEKLLNRLQSMDVYYAAPNVYKMNEKLVGAFAIGPDIPSVVPNEPYIIMNQVKGIEDWIVVTTRGGPKEDNGFGMIRYDGFINNAANKEYYDAAHVIVTLSTEEIKDMLEKYPFKL